MSVNKDILVVSSSTLKKSYKFKGESGSDIVSLAAADTVRKILERQTAIATHQQSASCVLLPPDVTVLDGFQWGCGVDASRSRAAFPRTRIHSNSNPILTSHLSPPIPL